MLIDYVTSKASAGAEVAYPLLHFRRNLAEAGLRIRLRFKLGYTKKEEKPDVLILSEPYFRDQYESNSAFAKVRDSVLKAAFAQSRKYTGKLVFFDTGDSTASTYLEYLPYVDLMLKWQVLSDRGHYCTDAYSRKPCVWVDELEQWERPKANPDHIHKLKVGWNLAYRNYSLLRKGGRHLHWRGITWNPAFTKVNKPRPILTSFRGQFSGVRASHRRAAIDAMSGMHHQAIVVGAPVARRHYLRELKSSKAVVSPFGHGEPCYRDMEAFIHGAILVKPSMAHVDTFPNVYKEHETYIPVDWDFHDLSTVLANIDTHYEELKSIAEAGQKLYQALLTDSQPFVSHFKSIVSDLLDTRTC